MACIQCHAYNIMHTMSYIQCYAYNVMLSMRSTASQLCNQRGCTFRCRTKFCISAGKLNHSGSDQLTGSAYSLVDYNRAGQALLEIVSEPDMRSGQDAAAYGAELRRIMVFLGVSDGEMSVCSTSENQLHSLFIYKQWAYSGSCFSICIACT